MLVHKGRCGSTHLCLVSIDALLPLLLAKQGVKRRIGDVKSPLNHNLPYVDDLHNATRTVCMNSNVRSTSKHVLPPSIHKPKGFRTQGIRR